MKSEIVRQLGFKLNPSQENTSTVSSLTFEKESQTPNSFVQRLLFKHKLSLNLFQQWLEQRFLFFKKLAELKKARQAHNRKIRKKRKHRFERHLANDEAFSKYNTYRLKKWLFDLAKQISESVGNVFHGLFHFIELIFTWVAQPIINTISLIKDKIMQGYQSAKELLENSFRPKLSPSFSNIEKEVLQQPRENPNFSPEFKTILERNGIRSLCIESLMIPSEVPLLFNMKRISGPNPGVSQTSRSAILREDLSNALSLRLLKIL